MTTSSKEPLIAGIDGDVLIYRSCFAAQYNMHTLKADDGTVIKQSQKKRELKEFQSLNPDANTCIDTAVVLRDEKTAIFSLKNTIKTILKNTEADSVIIYISGKSNFRIDIPNKAAKYKGNRGSEKPFFFSFIREYIINNYTHEISDYCEADDLLAINLTKAYKKALARNNTSKCRFICCSIDKDLTTVPGWHYNMTKKSLFWVNDFEACKFFYTQMLVGDVADNIKGIYGLGPASANMAFKDCKTPKDLEDCTIKEYKRNYNPTVWLERFLTTGRLLHMQRYANDLWKPLNKDIYIL